MSGSSSSVSDPSLTGSTSNTVRARGSASSSHTSSATSPSLSSSSSSSTSYPPRRPYRPENQLVKQWHQSWSEPNPPGYAPKNSKFIIVVVLAIVSAVILYYQSVNTPHTNNNTSSAQWSEETEIGTEPYMLLSRLTRMAASPIYNPPLSNPYLNMHKYRQAVAQSKQDTQTQQDSTNTVTPIQHPPSTTTTTTTNTIMSTSTSSLTSSSTSPFSAVYVTVPNMDVARKITSVLLEKDLVACANIIPGLTSIYKWKGKIEEDPELLMMMKTRSSLLPSIIENVRANHPYEVPEVIEVPILQGNPSYLKWIGDNTKPEITEAEKQWLDKQTEHEKQNNQS